MTTRFFISDHHFDHANSLIFKRADGSPLRDFESVEAMNEHMIACHNSVVKEHDIVYFLGDVTIPRKGLRHIARLNGRKKLIMGNHDVFVKKHNQDYRDAGFEQIEAFHKFDHFVCTHIPVHPAQLSTRWAANVHGHLHSNNVMLPRGVDAKTGEILYSDKKDPRYFCVCVEQINYTPISMDEILDIIGRERTNPANS